MKKNITILKRILQISLIALIILVFLAILGITLSGEIVEKSARDKLYNSAEIIPKNKVGLLLGTSKFVPGGKINLYYKYRLDAAVRLFKAGKIDFILVSGDNSIKEYDEPTTIKNDLVALGIPGEKIFLDYAGFRTLDSVVRSKAIFGQESITIISQQFHNERAIYIAKNHGIKAIGFNARDVSASYGFKIHARERFARVKMMLDLMIGKEPKFYGDKITIH